MAFSWSFFLCSAKHNFEYFFNNFQQNVISNIFVHDIWQNLIISNIFFNNVLQNVANIFYQYVICIRQNLIISIIFSDDILQIVISNIFFLRWYSAKRNKFEHFFGWYSAKLLDFPQIVILYFYLQYNLAQSKFFFLWGRGLRRIKRQI